MPRNGEDPGRRAPGRRQPPRRPGGSGPRAPHDRNDRNRAPRQRDDTQRNEDPFKKALREQEKFVERERPSPTLDAQDAADVERLQTIFDDNRARMDEVDRKKLDTAEEHSRILEAALTESAKRLFGTHAEVVLPTKFDDFKNATDAVLIFKNAEGSVDVAIAIDFATQQDVDGYVNQEGVHTKGLEKKWKRSLQGIADERQQLTKLKYLTITNSVTGTKETKERSGIPRVLLGLSDAEIKRVGALWGAGARERGLDLSKDPALVQLAQSLYRQLLAQLLIARSEGEKRGAARGSTVAEKSIQKAIDALKKVKESRAPGASSRPVSHTLTPTDPVLKRIHEITRPPALKTLYGDAVHDAAEQKRKFDAGEFHRPPVGTPMSPADWVKFDASLAERKVPVEVKAHVEAFLQNTSKPFFSWYLPMVAAAVPVRVWTELKKGAEKSARPGTPEFEASKKYFGEKVLAKIDSTPREHVATARALYLSHYAVKFPEIARARTHAQIEKIFTACGSGPAHAAVQESILFVKGFGVLPKIPVLPVPPTIPPIVPLGGGVPPHGPTPPSAAGESHGHERGVHAEAGKLTFAQHLEMIKTQVKMDKDTYAKYDTKSKRIKSWIGEKLGTLFGAQSGAIVGGMLAWCAGALAIPVTIGGAVLGAYLINRYMRHKGMDPDSRMRVAAIQKLALKAQNEPYTYKKIMADPHGAENFIKRDMLYRKLGSAALMVGIGGLASASMLHYRTGGAIWGEVGKSVNTGNWSNVWALFYCAPNGRGARAVAGHMPQGRGGALAQHMPQRMQTPRLNYGQHMNVLSRCQSPYGMGQFNAAFGPGGNRYVPTTVRTFGSGRWNG